MLEFLAAVRGFRDPGGCPFRPHSSISGSVKRLPTKKVEILVAFEHVEESKRPGTRSVLSRSACIHSSRKARDWVTKQKKGGQTQRSSANGPRRERECPMQRETLL